MKFILYNKIGHSLIIDSLGLPEYSYYFVFREYIAVFEALGEVVSVGSEPEIKSILKSEDFDYERTFLVCFCPPHMSPRVKGVKLFCVLAWEYNTIPDEVWDDNPANNWVDVLDNHVGVICLSSYSKKALAARLPSGFPIASIPVPVWDRVFQSDFEKKPELDNTGIHTIMVSGNVIDSNNYLISDESFEIIDCAGFFKQEPWDREAIELNFVQGSGHSAYLGGFYHAEPWGTWSRLSRPWLILTSQVGGNFKVTIVARGYGCSVGAEIKVSIGGVEAAFKLRSEVETYELVFQSVSPDNLLVFSNLNLSPVENVSDHRSMALGLQSLKIESLDNTSVAKKAEHTKAIKVDYSGVIYTTVFNPADARKCWYDIVTAFCYCFREVKNATLILKVTHKNLSTILGKLHFLLQQVGPIECRVIAVHGYLADEDYNRLISSTSFYVNASSAEGLCLPLMEFMAAGVPVIAPNHTAMNDYIDENHGYILDSTMEASIWPHDTRLKKRAKSYRVVWASLVKALADSYECYLGDKKQYFQFSAAASESICNYSNKERVTALTKKFLYEVKG